ncbi:phage tail protein [Aquabacter cavernae]|uniref:phage tail protein n=1 Tax=Aquabacter cavernae TaxID=2496029 RepID=UPI000F8F6B52|nr:tail fiber protein [Aquabacter cavernae]
MEAFVGEVRAFPYNFAPGTDETGWLACDGAAYSPQQYTALFSIIGSIYGGDRSTTFNVPDLRGRIAVGAGPAQVLPTVAYGEAFGVNDVTLTLAHIPAHNHRLSGAFTGVAADLSNNPGSGYAISRTFNQFDYSNEPQTPGVARLDDKTIGPRGGNLPHENRQPVLALTYFICYLGEYPMRP